MQAAETFCALQVGTERVRVTLRVMELTALATLAAVRLVGQEQVADQEL
jgi:hypothetical protein